MKKLLLLLPVFALMACDKLPADAYANRTDPENLLSKSTDIVMIDIGPQDWNYKLNDTILAAPPARAKLNCSLSNGLCLQAKDILIQRHVPFQITGTGQSVEMLYERVVAYNCVNRYIDNLDDNRNVNHPSFGCSVNANTVQMVSDKREFTNPALLDPIPAAR